MPQNSTGTIAVVTPIDDLDFYAFGPQDTYAAIAGIPANGVTLQLPANPSDGDRYEFADVLGNCNTVTPVIVNANGHQIQNEDQIVFYDAFDAAYFWFDATQGQWAVVGVGGATPVWRQQVFATTQTFKTPPGLGGSAVVDLWIDGWGGAGGGAGGQNGTTGATGQPGGGGGGGAVPLYDVHVYAGSEETITVTVGAGGAGGAVNTNGSPGTTSTVHSPSFGTIFIGVGASGGTATSVVATSATAPGGGPPVTSQGLTIPNLQGTNSAPGQGGHGGTPNPVWGAANASTGADNSAGFFGGGAGTTGTTNTNGGGYGGGGGGGGPGGQGGNGGNGGNGAASGEGVAATAASSGVANSGAGGGGGASGGNGASAGAAGSPGAAGQSGFVVVRWFV